MKAVVRRSQSVSRKAWSLCGLIEATHHLPVLPVFFEITSSTIGIGNEHLKHESRSALRVRDDSSWLSPHGAENVMNRLGKPATIADQACEATTSAMFNPAKDGSHRAPNIVWHSGQVSAEARQEVVGHRPATVWLTGLSGAGKSTIACELERLLVLANHPCFVLDGDNLRHGLNSDLGFSANDRKESIRRTAEVARLMNEAGLIVITALISPHRNDREMARAIIAGRHFVEVHVSTPIEVCETRDPKGLYAKARLGLIPEFTGVSSPYEPPVAPALVLDTGALPLSHCAQVLFQHLETHFFS